MPDQDLTAELPLLLESPASVRGRMLQAVNAGVDPTDSSYADDVPGGWFDDMSGAYSLEADRIYDRTLTEVPAAAMPTTAIGVWLDGWAAALGLARKPATYAEGVETFAGSDGTEIIAGTQVSTEQATADADPIVFQVVDGGTISGGAIDLAVQALNQGAQGNVPAASVTVLASPISGITITNATAITGGSDVETDEALSDRVGKRLTGTQGAGNVPYYENIALNYPGVGFVKVKPNNPSIGHVTVVIFDVNRDPAPTSMIDGLQAELDPSGSAGQGRGLAAPGATIIVATTTATVMAVTATLTLEDGFSDDGSAGTTDVTPDVLENLEAYFTTLLDGDTVIRSKVAAALVDVTGVADYTALSIASNTTTNVTVASGHTAELGAVTLS